MAIDSIQQIRTKRPQWADLPDDVVVDILRQSYYPDMTNEQLSKEIGAQMPVAPVQPSGAMRKLMDYPLAFAGGAVGATKAIADAAGAGNSVSNALNSASEGINSYLSPEAKAEDKQIAEIMADAKAKGMNLDGVMSGVKAFGVAPVRQMIGGLGSVVPVVAGAVVAPAGVPAALAAGGIGVAMGAGTAKGAIYDDVKKRHKAAGASEEEAEALAVKAQEYGGENTDQIALGGALGSVDALTGVTRVVTGIAKGAIGTAKGGVLRRAATGVLGEMPLEMAQGGQEKLAANIASQRAGFEVGTWDNVASNATLEGMASAGPGAAFGAMRQQEKTAGDLIRDTKVAESGALGRAANAGIESQAQAADQSSGLTSEQIEAEVDRLDAEAAQATQAAPESQPATVVSDAGATINTEAETAPETAIETQPQGVFSTPQEAQDYISIQRRSASASLPTALPIEYPDHSFGVATAGSPDFAEAERQKKSRVLIEAGVQEGDLLTVSGNIIKTKQAASAIAKKNGGDVVPVAGGFVVRSVASEQTTQTQNTDANFVHNSATDSGNAVSSETEIEDKIADFEYQATKFFKGGTEYLGRDFPAEYAALKDRHADGLSKPDYAHALGELMSEHEKSRQAYFAPTAKVNAEHAAMLKSLKHEPVSPEMESFDRSRDQAVNALSDEQLNQLGASLGLKQSKKQSRTAFVERITEQAGADVREAYSKIVKPFAPPHETAKSQAIPVTPPEIRAEQMRQQKIKVERASRLKTITYKKSPFLAFLGKHGITLSEKSEFSPDKNPILSGYGPMFRQNGQSLDRLMQNAVEEGYLPLGTNDQTALHELISRQIRGEKIEAMYTEDGATNVMQAEIDRRASFDEEQMERDAEAQLQQQFDEEALELIANSAFIDENYPDPIDALLELGFTHKDIEDTYNDYNAQNSGQSENAQAGGSASSATPREAQSAGAETPSPAQEEGLTTPTREDVLAQQAQKEREEQRQKDGGDKVISKKVTADQVDLFNPQGGIFDTPNQDAQVESSVIDENTPPTPDELKALGDITITIQTDSGAAKLTINAEKAIKSLDERASALEMVRKCVA